MCICMFPFTYISLEIRLTDVEACCGTEEGQSEKNRASYRATSTDGEVITQFKNRHVRVIWIIVG